MQFIAVLIGTHCNALIKNRHLYLHIGINRDKITPFRLQINQEDRTIHDIGWIWTIIWLKCYAYFLQHALHMHIIIMTMHFRPWLVLNLIFAAIYFSIWLSLVYKVDIYLYITNIKVHCDTRIPCTRRWLSHNIKRWLKVSRLY